MKILIIDDHGLFREGLRHLLHGLAENVTILEAANHDVALFHISKNHDIDLILLDLNLPGKNGFETLRHIAKNYSALPVIILSATDKSGVIKRAVNSGAMGYIIKNSSSKTMLDAIKVVLSGNIYLPPDMLVADKDPYSITNQNSYQLTPRQTDVLNLLINGSSNKEIANALCLTEATVKVHITNIFKAMNVKNRTQAAMSAEVNGFIVSNS